MARRARSTSTVRPIEHLSLVDRVTDELRRAILIGDIKPGSVVSIVELCEQFDVSHIPVREALRRLESEGIISLRPGRSALVAELSLRDLTDIFRLRRIIEGDLVMRAVDGMTDERIAEAEAALADYAAVERDFASLAAVQHDFHAALLADVWGATDRRVLELLWHATERYLHLLMGDPASGAGPQDSGVADRQRIVDLAHARDAMGTRDTWVTQLDANEHALRSALESRNAGPEV